MMGVYIDPDASGDFVNNTSESMSFPLFLSE